MQNWAGLASEEPDEGYMLRCAGIVTQQTLHVFDLDAKLSICKIICQGRRGSRLLVLAWLPSLLSRATAVVHWCLEGCSKAFGAAS